MRRRVLSVSASTEHLITDIGRPGCWDFWKIHATSSFIRFWLGFMTQNSTRRGGLVLELYLAVELQPWDEKFEFRKSKTVHQCKNVGVRGNWAYSPPPPPRPMSNFDTLQGSCILVLDNGKRNDVGRIPPRVPAEGSGLSATQQLR